MRGEAGPLEINSAGASGPGSGTGPIQPQLLPRFESLLCARRDGVEDRLGLRRAGKPLWVSGFRV